jgi:hypothetical protein
LKTISTESDFSFSDEMGTEMGENFISGELDSALARQNRTATKELRSSDISPSVQGSAL